MADYTTVEDMLSSGNSDCKYDSWQKACVQKGKEQALVECSKELWKKIYMDKPDPALWPVIAALEKIELDKYNYERYVMITIRPDPKGWKKKVGKRKLKNGQKIYYDMKYEFEKICDGLSRRKWILEGEGYYETKASELYNDEETLHYHWVGKLKKNYSPKQIHNLLMQGRIMKYLCWNPASVDVKKGSEEEKFGMESYAMKECDSTKSEI